MTARGPAMISPDRILETSGSKPFAKQLPRPRAHRAIPFPDRLAESVHCALRTVSPALAVLLAVIMFSPATEAQVTATATPDFVCMGTTKDIVVTGHGITVGAQNLVFSPSGTVPGTRGTDFELFNSDGTKSSGSTVNLTVAQNGTITLRIQNITRTSGTLRMEDSTGTNYVTFFVYLIGTSDSRCGSVTIDPTSLALTELGAANEVEKTYTAVLGTDPASTVTVTATVPTANKSDIQIKATGGTFASSATLTFTGGTSGNWNRAQAFTVRASHDNDGASPDPFNITHAAVSTDTGSPYHEAVIDPVAVTVTDAGHGVVVSESSLQVTENSQTATYRVSLKSRPGGSLTITPMSSAPAMASVSGALTFNNNNWRTPQIVTVTGASVGTLSISLRVTDATSDYPTTTPIASVSVTVIEKPPPPLNISKTSLNIGEGEDGSFTVAPGIAPSGGTVMVTVESDNPIVQVSPGTLTFTSATWNSAQTVTVSGLQDNDSADEQASVTLSWEHTGGDMEFDGLSSEVEVTVDDDEQLHLVPGVTVTGPASAATEGGKVVFTVTRGGVVTEALEVEIRVSENEADGRDFVAMGDEGVRTVTIPVGASFASYEVATVDDDVDEPNGELTVYLVHTNDYYIEDPGSHSVAVNDDDGPVTPGKPVVSISGGSDVTEGTAASFTISRTGATSASLTVLIAVGENAADSRNFVAAGDEGNKSVTIPVGSASATYTVLTANDDVDEPDGSVTVSLRSSSGYTRGTSASASVAVNDNDEPPTDKPVVSISGGSGVTEGTAVSFTISRTGATSASLTVLIEVSENTAGGQDFVAAGDEGDKSVMIPVGSASIGYTVTTENDNADEPDGSVSVSLRSSSDYTRGTSASASVAVSDDDVPPPGTPEVSITGGSGVTEGTAASFTISRTGATSASLTVLIEVSENTAGGRDFVAAGDEGDKSVMIPVGSASIAYPVPTENDNTDEPDGSVTVSLRSSIDYTSGTSASASVAVSDDDQPPPGTPEASFATSSSSAPEDTGTREVTVSFHPAPSQAITLAYEVSGSATAADFSIAGSGSAAVSANASSIAIPVAIIDDREDEGAETVILTLADSADYDLGSRKTHTLRIIDNDEPPGLGISVSGLTVGEGGAAAFTVRLDTEPTDTVTVTVSSSHEDIAVNGGAVAELVFTTSDWSEPQMVTVTASEDEDSLDERARVTVSSAQAGGGSEYAGLSEAVPVTVFDDEGLSASSPHGLAAKAGLVRFARAVGSQTLAAVQDRLKAARAPGIDIRLAGGSLSTSHADEAQIQALEMALSDSRHDRETSPRRRTMSETELLAGTSLSAAVRTDSDAILNLWIKGERSGFKGRRDDLSLDGEVSGVRLGADLDQNGQVFGLMLSRSSGDTDYRTDSVSGRMKMELSAVTAFAGSNPVEDIHVWGALGVGDGSFTVSPGGVARKTGIDKWHLAAVGAEGDLPGSALLPKAQVGWRADAMWTRIASESSARVASLGGRVSRMRIAADAAWERMLANETVFRLDLSIALRHDAGDAETGMGLEVGGGFDLRMRNSVLSLDATALAAHDDSQYRNWGARLSYALDRSPTTKRGLSVSVSQSLGGLSSGAASLLEPEAFPEAKASGRERRWKAEAAFGISRGFGMVGSPYLALDGAAAADSARMGYRIEPDASYAPNLTMDVWVRTEVQTDSSVGATLAWHW